MSDHPTHFPAALAEAARVIDSAQEMDDTLATIVEAARLSVPGFDHVGLSLVHRDGRIETLAATDDLVRDLDDAQYELGEGPCVDAMRTDPPGRLFLLENLDREPRWPRYRPIAVEAGLRSQLGIQLFTDRRVMGGLNLYSTTEDTVHRDALVMGEAFAAHVAVALGHAHTSAELIAGTSTRQTVGVATGIVMERYGLDESRAFDVLARLSTTTQRKVRDVAQDVVDGRVQQAGPGAS